MKNFKRTQDSGLRKARTRWPRGRPGLAMFACLALALVAFVAVSCGDDDDGGGSLKKVTLMLNWTPNTQHSGIYIAKEKGYYRDQGLDVQIVEPAASGVEQVVANGNADFGISVQEAVIPAREQGIPLVSIAAILQHNDSSFMALKDSGIARPKDFEGKTYGGYGGPLETEILSQLMKCDGGDPGKLKTVEVGNIDYIPGMQNGSFDFVWVFEGWDVLRANDVLKTPVNSVKFKDYLDCIPDWYTPVIVTSEAKIKDDPETVRKFMAATARGYDEANKDAKSAADALMKGAPESDKALVDASAAYHVGKYMDSGRKWGLQDMDVWQKFEAFLKDAGLIEKDIDVKAAFTNDFLPK